MRPFSALRLWLAGFTRRAAWHLSADHGDGAVFTACLFVVLVFLGYSAADGISQYAERHAADLSSKLEQAEANLAACMNGGAVSIRFDSDPDPVANPGVPDRRRFFLCSAAPMNVKPTPTTPKGSQ